MCAYIQQSIYSVHLGIYMQQVCNLLTLNENRVRPRKIDRETNAVFKFNFSANLTFLCKFTYDFYMATKAKHSGSKNTKSQYFISKLYFLYDFKNCPQSLGKAEIEDFVGPK